jgi:hypothetical protein
MELTNPKYFIAQSNNTFGGLNIFLPGMHSMYMAVSSTKISFQNKNPTVWLDGPIPPWLDWPFFCQEYTQCTWWIHQPTMLVNPLLVNPL